MNPSALLEWTLNSGVVKELEAAWPLEGCGFIVETEMGLAWVKAKNCSTTPQEDFELSPEEVIGVLEARGLVAIVHSHRGASTLSSKDIMGATFASPQGREPFYPGILWLVIGIRDGRVEEGSVWKINGSKGEGSLAGNAERLAFMSCL